MNHVIAGNVFSLLATGTDIYSSSAKSTKRILLAQTVSQVLLGLSSLVLGGYSAVVQNVVSAVRNLTAAGNKSFKWIEYLLIALGVILGMVFNNLGILGWLPIVANLEYSLAVFRFKNNERMLKTAFAACIVMYAVFNLFLKNYVGALSNLAVLFTTVFFLLKGKNQSASYRKN